MCRVGMVDAPTRAGDDSKQLGGATFDRRDRSARIGYPIGYSVCYRR